MNCIRCGRALSLAKVTVTTKAGQSSWGPVCARKAGLLPGRTATTRAAAKSVTARRRTEDEKQLQLELTA